MFVLIAACASGGDAASDPKYPDRIMRAMLDGVLAFDRETDIRDGYIAERERQLVWEYALHLEERGPQRLLRTVPPPEYATVHEQFREWAAAEVDFVRCKRAAGLEGALAGMCLAEGMRAVGLALALPPPPGPLHLKWEP